MRNLRLAAAVGTLLTVLVSGQALPQEAAQTPLDVARAAVQRSSLDDAQRAVAFGLLDAAIEDEREAARLTQRLSDLRAEVADVPARLEQLSAALTVDREQALLEWAKRLPADADGETLERLLEQERTLLREEQAQIDAVGVDLATTVSRPATATTETAALRRRIEQLMSPAAVADGEPAPISEARRLRRASELKRLQAELDLRTAEQETGTQRQRLFELSLRELRYRQSLQSRRIELLQQRIADRRRSQLEALLERLQGREAEVAGATPVVARAAIVNRVLGDELKEHNERLARERSSLADIESAREHVTTTLRDSRTRLELGGMSERVGEWLWSERRRLEPPARLRQRLELVRVALAELRLRLVVLNEQQRELADTRAAARTLVEVSLEGTDEAEVAEESVEQLQPELRQRVELIGLLESQVLRRVAALEQGERALNDQLDRTVELQRLLDRHLLWIPSHASVGGDWLARAPDGLRDLVKRSRFVTTCELIVRDARERTSIWIFSFLLLAASIAARWRARPWIEAQAAPTRKIREDSFLFTLRALAGTIVGAAPVPLGFALLGVLLQGIGDPGRFSHSLGRAFMTLVPTLSAIQLVRWTSLERGLGHAHFRWTRQRREAVRASMPILAWVVLPLVFVTQLAMARQVDVSIDVNARIAIVVMSLTLAWQLWRTLDAGQLWVVRGVVSEPSTVRRALRFSLSAAFLAIALLAILGYVYTTAVIMRAALTTFTLVVFITIGIGLLARWFLLGERRLMVRRRAERQIATVGSDAEAGEVLQEPDADLTLEQINAQTGRIVRAVRLSLLALGLVWVWAELLPAIARLDEIALWHFTEIAADGSPVQAPLTLAGALLGVFALVLTTIGARNLPGLIEISLLSRTHIDAASRYAITSMLRYAITIGGTIIGLGFLGMRWSQLQWLAAALTVGLGFGLQEIFANFVSGLILLFERPFRVGDTITVDNLSGRVTRIRTRATTILDFDNKEIVVPNKTFITGQLVNWTLTDTTTRITIHVGVAYGSPIDTVHALLLKAAREEPRVLEDPEPLSWFLAFGASSLDFELRVFVGTLGDRLVVQNALNTRIAELFAEHDIEIAFPQLDLHVRDVPRAPDAGAAPQGS